jgi:hypothetical protein
MDLINRLGQSFHHVAPFLPHDKVVVTLGLALLPAPPVNQVNDTKNENGNKDAAKGSQPNRILGETRTDTENDQWEDKKGNGDIYDWKEFPNPRGHAQLPCQI